MARSSGSICESRYVGSSERQWFPGPDQRLINLRAWLIINLNRVRRLPVLFGLICATLSIGAGVGMATRLSRNGLRYPPWCHELFTYLVLDTYSLSVKPLLRAGYSRVVGVMPVPADTTRRGPIG
jgi:hypothetical protein